MISFPLWVPTLVVLLLSAFVAWISMKSRADLATFKNELLDLFKAELKEYVNRQQFAGYSDSHAREHIARDEIVSEFMTRHRDWKHTVEPALRILEMNQADFKEHISGTAKEFRKITEGLQDIKELIKPKGGK